ncbi:MAG TPA: molecular chaperone HtpG [Kiritimatiellia bacterium]|nr:molecular chaperone HtpG [Kiritimatiellia bacterium]HMO98525.1 molecular chaperone HtpG [Kiritimatiellia bacterium]HMP97714.1 molecular chaperone HtpG [Kiritimatiellia bacterium]
MTAHAHPFKAEVRQLLDLVIHSLYSKKEIFLRELISNASDAIDRARFEALTHKSLQREEDAWSITVVADKKNRTLTITDNGIGMSAREVEENIGTIASSGTRRFLETLKSDPKAAANPEMIGRFGVGFYSAFMVAEEVAVVTRRGGMDEPALKWTSTGDDSYTLEESSREDFGTTVTLKLREGQEEFLEPWRLQTIIKHYSDYISFPIRLTVVDAEGKEEPKDEIVNSRKAIWKKAASEVAEDEYQAFYRHISHAADNPAKVIHVNAEGVTEFRALLFVPSQAPYDLFMRDGIKGIHLYVRNVFITDDCKELLPPYLRFLRGVVDSSDLPLNVSREMLQDDAIIRRIRKSLTGKVLGTLADMKQKQEKEYRSFFATFGRVLKEGVHLDFENKQKIADLLLFDTTRTEDKLPIDLKSYVDRMPSEQKDMYYIAGDSIASLKASPLLEAFERRSYEVLLLADPIDEWVVMSLPEYAGKKLVAIDRGDIDLGTEEEKKAAQEKKKEREEAVKDLLSALQKHLDADIKEVRLSSRLTDSACCLVNDDSGISPHMERILKAMDQEVPPSKRILEINPGHPLIEKLEGWFKADPSDERINDYADLLLGQAQIAEGAPVKNPTRFTKLVSRLMAV